MIASGKIERINPDLLILSDKQHEMADYLFPGRTVITINKSKYNSSLAYRREINAVIDRVSVGRLYHLTPHRDNALFDAECIVKRMTASEKIGFKAKYNNSHYSELISWDKNAFIKEAYNFNMKEKQVVKSVDNDTGNVVKSNGGRGHFVLLVNVASDKHRLIPERLINYINHKFKDKNPIITIDQPVPINELVTRIKDAYMIVTTDSFVSHLAVILGRRAVVIAGKGSQRFLDPTNFNVVTDDPCAYENCDWLCRYKINDNYKCIESIKEVTLDNALNQFINQYRSL
ncbi:hypothetical protein ACFL96_00045 [Thermoproteota archaeon]